MADPERADTVWLKSSLSESGQCVEVRFLAESVGVRHSHDPSGPVLTFTQAEWDAFIGGVRKGDFDPPAGPSAIA